MQRLNNSISFKNNPSKKNHNLKLFKKSKNNNIITPRTTKSKAKKNSNTILRNALLKRATEKIGENIKQTNLNKNKYLRKEVENNVLKDNMNSMNNKKSEANKANNVTNNICIIIKTSENQKQKELKNDDYNFDYIDTIKINENNINNNSHNQNPLITENINFNLKSSNLKNKQLEHNNFGEIKLKSQNNSFVFKKRHIRTQKNSIEKNNSKAKKSKINIKSKQSNSKLKNKENDNKNDQIKTRYKNDNFLTQKNSQKYKKRIIIPNIKNSNFGNYKNESGYSKEKYFTELSEKNIDRRLDNIMCSPIKSNRNVFGLSYKELIQHKKKLLRINLNIKEKKEVGELFINYDKVREEIEEKIKFNDEKIKINRKKINNKSQKEQRRIFSSEISLKSNICNFFLDSKKNKDKSNDSSKNIENILNNDNNISKSEISYIQTEINKEEIKKYINLIKPENNSKTLNNSKKSKKKINIKYKKRSLKKMTEKYNNKNNNRDSFNSNNNIRNSINKLSKNNSGLLNSKSCMDDFIKESKMNKNINIILKDIKKIININKSDINKEANKFQKKPQKNIPKNEVLMIQDSEHGKTLHCIKKLSKDKVQEEIQIKTISSEKNIEEEEPKKIYDLLFNFKKKYKRKSKKDENKNLEIKIPGEEIQALRRIKSKIHHYKLTNQNQNKYKKNEYIKLRKYKSFSYFNMPKNNNKFINKYKIERTNSLKVEYKNEKSIFHKLKFY